MAKRKINQLHKIKIHHNRYLIWSIVYILSIAIAIVGYIKISDIILDTEIFSENKFIPSQSYRDTRLGFLIRYPGDWSIEADSNSTINFLPSDFSNNGVMVSVLEPSAEKSVRSTLRIVNETPITLDSHPALKLTHDLGRGFTETVILSVRDNRLYVIRGMDSFVERVVSTFDFLNK